MRLPNVHYSVCPHNCWPVNCGLRVEVEDGRLCALAGNPHHDFSRGRLCVKGQASGEIQRSPHRLTRPMKRAGARGAGAWEPITWDEALDTIAARMRANRDGGRPQANAVYHSHGNIVQRVNWKVLTPRFANLVGATLWDGNFPCWYDVGLAQALTGYWGLHDPVETGAHAAALVNWAQDPAASQANMVPYLLQVRDRGGEVVTIDPRVTQTAALSTWHLRPRLGSDVWLANGVAAVMLREGLVDEAAMARMGDGFEAYRAHVLALEPRLAARECELDLKDLERLAALYGQGSPLCTNLTRGALGKHWNGVQMVRAVLCLVALGGHIGVRGGGVVWGEAVDWNPSLQAQDRAPATPAHPNNFNAIDAALDSGAIDTLLVVGGNPLSQWPNLNRLRAQLARVPLVVVNDLFLNHTARQADLVLPATSWLEELGLRASNSRIYLMDQALPPLGESREASWWMDRLARRLGVEDYFPWPDKEACLDACLASAACAGASVAELRRRPEGMPAHVAGVPYADHRFQTPTGRFAFFSAQAETLGLPPLPTPEEAPEGARRSPGLLARFPLQLVSERRNTHFHSFHDSHRLVPTLRSLEPEPLLHVHPRDGAARGVADGDLAELFNDRGTARVRVEWTTEMAAGQVGLNDGWPELNLLTSSLCPVAPAVTAVMGLGGQPAYQNALVQLRKVAP